jgi:hypothetical protein
LTGILCMSPTTRVSDAERSLGGRPSFAKAQRLPPKLKTIMRPTIAVREPAAAIELGVGSGSVTAHKIIVRSTQTKARSFDAKLISYVYSNDIDVSYGPLLAACTSSAPWPAVLRERATSLLARAVVPIAPQYRISAELRFRFHWSTSQNEIVRKVLPFAPS